MTTRRHALKGLAAGAAAIALPTVAGSARKQRLVVRRAGDRGHANHGWLDSHHTFSFAGYRDPAHMGLGSLRVINEDRVIGGKGFPMHGHRDMEILTWVLDGALEHRDSMGNGSIIKPGDIQHMSAGRGVRHSEFNPSSGDGVHFLQIWIIPEQRGLEPSYAQLSIARDRREGRLYPLASRRGGKGTIRINQDATLYNGLVRKGTTVKHTIETGRKVWLQVARGSVVADGTTLQPGDGAWTNQAMSLSITARTDAEVLLFDLA